MGTSAAVMAAVMAERLLHPLPLAPSPQQQQQLAYRSKGGCRQQRQ